MNAVLYTQDIYKSHLAESAGFTRRREAGAAQVSYSTNSRNAKLLSSSACYMPRQLNNGALASLALLAPPVLSWENAIAS
jgi:hypothetical protein